MKKYSNSSYNTSISNSYKNFKYRVGKYPRNRYPYTILLMLVLIVLFVFQVVGVINSQLVVLDTQKIVEFNLTTAFTSLFFHAGVYHLLFNLIALYFFSRYVEKELGVGTIFLFIIGGMIANILVSI